MQSCRAGSQFENQTSRVRRGLILEHCPETRMREPVTRRDETKRRNKPTPPGEMDGIGGREERRQRYLTRVGVVLCLWRKKRMEMRVRWKLGRLSPARRFPDTGQGVQLSGSRRRTQQIAHAANSRTLGPHLGPRSRDSSLVLACDSRPTLEKLNFRPASYFIKRTARQ
jgi:hypothetical protein